MFATVTMTQQSVVGWPEIIAKVGLVLPSSRRRPRRLRSLVLPEEFKEKFRCSTS